VKLLWSSNAWEDYLHWQANDPKMLERINGLIKECLRDPFRGTGKPEPLRENLKGCWSRRINTTDRLVYRATGKGDDQVLEILQCRYHY
jgi:toxin YoeB